MVSEVAHREPSVAATHSGLVAMPGGMGTVALLFEGSVHQWLLLR